MCDKDLNCSLQLDNPPEYCAINTMGMLPIRVPSKLKDVNQNTAAGLIINAEVK